MNLIYSVKLQPHCNCIYWDFDRFIGISIRIIKSSVLSDFYDLICPARYFSFATGCFIRHYRDMANTNTPPPHIRQTVTALDDALREMTERVERLSERAMRVDVRLELAERRLARGTAHHMKPLREEDTKPARRVPQTRDHRATMAEIHRLLEVRPRTYSELRELTGTQHPHTANALIQLQREGVPMKNIGTARRAIWALKK